MRRSQIGMTLLELVISLGLMAGVMTGLYTLVDTFNQNTRAAVVSQHMSTVGQAAQAYIKDNYAAVSAVATATTPALIRISTLTGANYLQTGYTVANTYNQNVCVLVLQPVANQLAALVVAEGGSTIDDLSLGQIAALMGAAGGGVYSTATTTLKGAMGGWSTAVGNFANANAAGLHCDGTAGTVSVASGRPIMALWFAGGDVTSGFLYRNAVAGHPELNQMQTTLDMNSNAITNAATIGLNTVVVASGACTTNGVVARDATGGVMSCVSGAWKAAGGGYWKDPVANYASLPAASNTVGDVRLTTDTSRAFSWTGAAWKALALDQLGRLIATGAQSTYGQLTIQGGETNGWSGINFKDTAGTNVGTLMMRTDFAGFYNNLDTAWNWYVDNSGNSIQPGNAQAGTLQVNTAVAEGSACSPDGKIAKSSATSGLLLSCQSGVWKKHGGYTSSRTQSFFSGNASCGAGELMSSCIVMHPSGGLANIGTVTNGVCVDQGGGLAITCLIP